MSEISLRDRKKAATMHRVQEVAVGLFEEHGFDAVTVEQVAAAAEVSPSTVYRYFGTKEGLALHDEHDDVLVGAIAELVAEHDVWTAGRLALERLEQPHFVADAALTVRRTRLWVKEPALRAATVTVVARFVDAVAPLVAASPHNDLRPDQARVLVTALTWGAVTAIENWYTHDPEGSLGVYLREMLDLVRDA